MMSWTITVSPATRVDGGHQIDVGADGTWFALEGNGVRIKYSGDMAEAVRQFAELSVSSLRPSGYWQIAVELPTGKTWRGTISDFLDLVVSTVLSKDYALAAIREMIDQNNEPAVNVIATE